MLCSVQTLPLHYRLLSVTCSRLPIEESPFLFQRKVLISSFVRSEFAKRIHDHVHKLCSPFGWTNIATSEAKYIVYCHRNFWGSLTWLEHVISIFTSLVSACSALFVGTFLGRTKFVARAVIVKESNCLLSMWIQALNFMDVTSNIYFSIWQRLLSSWFILRLLQPKAVAPTDRTAVFGTEGLANLSL